MLELFIDEQKFDKNTGTKHIREIRDGDVVLARYNEQDMKIDLEPCRNYIGSVIKFITTTVNEKTKKIEIDLCKKAVLLGVKEDDGLKYLVYDLLEENDGEIPNENNTYN